MIDLEHILRRLSDPFDPASRYYWPLAVAAFAAIAANVAWYYWRQRGTVAPDERLLRPWAMWTNVLFLIWILVLLIAKTPFWLIPLSLAVNVAILVYMYGLWLPPREAAWAREQRRLRYIPRAERRRRR
ncbi:MAG TPA: hypothetical protein VFM93_11200 [Candidatus Limnocylindria bacterium]|nr:hypothetical protein [Candidatus Limnocylindria bacterium]